MAATLTGAGELTQSYFSFPITKTETTADGDVVVYGKASDGSVDSDEQIVDPEWMAKAVQDWLASGANVRVQHNPQRDPAGVGIEASTDANGDTWVKSLVVEPTAKLLVQKGALRAYSVGIGRPKVVRDPVARGGRITDGELVEISLVDRPANKNCGVQLVAKNATTGQLEFTGKTFGMPKDASPAFSPADLAKLLEHRRVAEEMAVKRQMDPDVGGGVDRDKIPAADFAGRDRSFPIVKPGDVADAAASIGRAGPENYSSDELRRRITSIARRKGPQFVAELPEKWKDEMTGKAEADEVTDETVEKGKPFEGAKKPFGSEDSDGSDGDGSDVDEEDEDEKSSKSAKEPEATKGEKDCAKCGKSYHADAKVRTCEGCGAKLPKANKGRKKADAAKGHDSVCLGCGHGLDDDDKFCSECGKANPSNEAASKSETIVEGAAVSTEDTQAVVEKGKPTPGAGVVGGESIQPVPAHREPDGAAIEAFEADAGLPTDPDSEVLAAMRVKSAGAPIGLGALHDTLCAAFEPGSVDQAHPTFKGADAVDVSYWMNQAMDASANAPLEQATKAAALWQHAVTLKNLAPEELRDLREELHKSFQDANPGSASFPQPTQLSATRFRRPAITAGHAAPSPGHDGPHTHPVPSGTITAAQYTRGPLTAGQAADSPANKGMARTFYTNASREAAREAMAAIHDHISGTFPELCSMTEAFQGPSPDARPVPQAVGAAKAEDTAEVAAKAEDTAPVTKSKAQRKLAKALKSVNAARAELGLAELDEAALVAEKAAELPTVTKGAVAAEADPVTTAMDQIIAGLREEFTSQLAEVTKALQTERERADKLQADVDALSDLPDPAVAPFKGVAQPQFTQKSSPVGAVSVAEAAERQKREYMAQLQQEWRTNPDPLQREMAERKLRQLNGL